MHVKTSVPFTFLQLTSLLSNLHHFILLILFLENLKKKITTVLLHQPKLKSATTGVQETV